MIEVTQQAMSSQCAPKKAKRIIICDTRGRTDSPEEPMLGLFVFGDEKRATVLRDMGVGCLITT